ncbi:hypothetical protein PKB_0787 [Pseudomonas knackmussii B13]|uniref:Uncharacterized protein n=1 Tax=Pseudomonas knackmussii (strain DSM 6978 / CCUG 54928 / LMG 23759 / B13) TaxID=1301098 RepID=A0A024HAS3_PSEKB|nr:hypothetical protein [Pseudomonas knackmussii]CDF82155.1 hypothetical protein PKB_0787 [Pseudomonas knackmussii B13]
MWVQIAILVVSALINYATRSKPTKPEPQEVTTPTAEEGKKLRKVYGTVWVDDAQVLGFKKMGTDPIQTKGGKK